VLGFKLTVKDGNLLETPENPQEIEKENLSETLENLQEIEKENQLEIESLQEKETENLQDAEKSALVLLKTKILNQKNHNKMKALLL
jgi:hypothetical protein